MRADDLGEGVLDDIAVFSDEFDKPTIVSQVQQQAARKNPMWKRTLVGLMAQHGFKLIGAGVNGAVFQHPNYDYVLKVYRTDGGYDEWLHFARTHVGNPYVPVMRGGIIRLNSVFNAVRLETLKACPLESANRLCFEIEGLINSYEKIVAMREENRALADVALFMRDWEPVSDLTHHNVMQRKNGQPVIVDPLYWEPGTDLDF
jgi:hypothetical protein